jgi:hypothetical protein
MESETIFYIFIGVSLLALIVIIILCFTKSNYEGPGSKTIINKKQLFAGPLSGPSPKSKVLGPAPKSKVSGNNWCEELGGKLTNNECIFPSWYSCVKSLECESDPSVVHPGWYDADKSKNYDDVAQAMINGGMDIVDVCVPANTSWNSNPRCKIKEGEYSGKTGICVYDGVNVNKCQPIGQGCKVTIDDFCPGFYGDPFSGKIKKQHLMCRQTKNENGENKVTAVCAY